MDRYLVISATVTPAATSRATGRTWPSRGTTSSTPGPPPTRTRSPICSHQRRTATGTAPAAWASRVDGVVGRGVVPEHGPAVLRAGQPRRAAADGRRLRAPLGRVQAHNRWLADFCAAGARRRAGIAQIFLNDIDDALAEVDGPRTHGLFGGILLPVSPPDCGIAPLWDPVYEPLWDLCEELDVVDQHPHAAVGCPTTASTRRRAAIMLIELAVVRAPPGVAPDLRRSVRTASRSCASRSPSRARAGYPRGLDTLDWFHRRMITAVRRKRCSSARSPRACR